MQRRRKDLERACQVERIEGRMQSNEHLDQLVRSVVALRNRTHLEQPFLPLFCLAPPLPNLYYEVLEEKKKSPPPQDGSFSFLLS